MQRLKGRVAVITGAARGIGRGIVDRFVEEGASVLLVDVLADALKQTASEFSRYAPRVSTLAVDLLARDAPNLIREAAESIFGSIDILVNNAGIGIIGRVQDFADEEWDRTLGVNLTAPFRLCREIVPGMAERGFGRVINISSFAATAGERDDSAYAVSKAGLEALTRSVAVDYGSSGVTCNAIAPGFIMTPLSKAVFETIDKHEPVYVVTAVNKPVRVPGQPEDIAAAAAYLASDDARYVTGHTLAVDGGAGTVRYVPGIEGKAPTRFGEMNQ
ncbi:MAG: SDR family NAD(P)-dependent oxidoreductase [Thermomicrobiales bacterium]